MGGSTLLLHRIKFISQCKVSVWQILRFPLALEGFRKGVSDNPDHVGNFVQLIGKIYNSKSFVDRRSLLLKNPKDESIIVITEFLELTREKGVERLTF